MSQIAPSPNDFRHTVYKCKINGNLGPIIKDYLLPFLVSLVNIFLIGVHPYGRILGALAVFTSSVKHARRAAAGARDSWRQSGWLGAWTVGAGLENPFQTVRDAFLRAPHSLSG